MAQPVPTPRPPARQAEGLAGTSAAAPAKPGPGQDVTPKPDAGGAHTHPPQGVEARVAALETQMKRLLTHPMLAALAAAEEIEPAAPQGQPGHAP